MKLILYGTETSPPVRAVCLTLRALGLEYEFRQVNMQAGEHLDAEFVRKNPQHTVPMLEDVPDGSAEEGQCIWDSHAICAYLVRKYGKNDALYPKEYFQRAIVDQRLHFESGVLFHSGFKQLQRLVFKENATEIPKEKISEIHQGYELLEQFLSGNDYVAGAQLTIADFSIVSTISTLHLTYAPVDGTKYPKLSAWLARVATLSYYEEANLQGARALAEKVRAKLPKQFDKLWHKAFAEIKGGAGKA
ncbi:glutathione S-transferase 1 [Scaptodrosophila lebanonensis]|uniref:Glutathione S-transferase 1 n=1 Tax=Drosophila lebanonensis TaxID=7225 RepID=A0A6J2UBG5_DROLE|nr:glutathione S-transferase 1 [Scaptodrosophila lebanonensis]